MYAREVNTDINQSCINGGVYDININSACNTDFLIIKVIFQKLNHNNITKNSEMVFIMVERYHNG